MAISSSAQQLAASVKSLIGHQIRREMVSRPRGNSTTIFTRTHDQAVELVIGGEDDISYAIISTTTDYTPPSTESP